MLRARDIMNAKFLTVPSTMTIGDLTDLFQRAHIHAAPVIDGEGVLVGIVSQEDILYGTMGGERADLPRRIRSRAGMLELDELEGATDDAVSLWQRPVTEIMTRPPLTVQADAGVREICRLLWSVRIHHLPVVDGPTLIGLISSLDLCRAVAEGQIPS